MNGKSLLRYDPALDFAVTAFGITGVQTDERRLVEGDGLAVHWVNLPPFQVNEVTTEDGTQLASPARDRADDLVFRALGATGLR
jgi:hypothetical protein